MMRLLCFLIFAAGPAAAGETVELSAASPRDAKIPGTLQITRLEAQVTMRGLLTETQATLTLAMEADPAQRMEGRLVFPLPPDCVLTGAALDIGEKIMRPASVTFKATAKQAYDSVVSRMLDPCLIQLLPDGRVRVQVFPFTGGAPRKLRIEFAQTLPPGATWRFPLTFAAPVPEAVLKADAPVVLGTEERKNFSGGAEWNFTAPAENAELTAHPDGNGRWFFQTLLPPAEPAEPPHHLLVLADVSLLHAQRDAAAERAFLERLFQKMQAGRVTLATFSTVLHGQAEYAVRDGKCGELLAVLEALKFDGAPRPGAVDVSGIPADLTLVLSTLAAPMGGGTTPRLPANAPVWVLDSVSPAPTAAALLLAAETGGMAFDLRTAPEISFRRRQAVTTGNLTGVSFHLLPPSGWLVTGELSGERGEFTAGGKTMPVPKGNDSAAGTLTARQRSRESFVHLTAERAGLLREEMLTGPNTAPFLTEATAFIVMEQAYDYQRWEIPLPPDMERSEPQAPNRQEKSEREAFEFDRALRRPAGTAGEPSLWYHRLRSYEKRSAVGSRMENDARFEAHRRSTESLPKEFDWLKKDSQYPQLKKKTESARGELSRLAGLFRSSVSEGAADLIHQARNQQQAEVEMVEFLDVVVGDGMMHSGGGPGADPFSGPTWISEMNERRAADPFAGTSADAFAAGGADAGEGRGAPAVVPSPPATATGTGRGGGAPQIPQTFGGGGAFGAQTFGGGGGWPGGGDLFDWYDNGEVRRGPFSYYKRAAHSPPRVAVETQQILAPAMALRTAGKKPEAIRALSRLAIPGQHDHALLRLLAWVLQEWGEPVLALEVLEQAERRFGSSDTTARDLALAALTAGRKDEAQQYFLRTQSHVARREAAAMNGNISAALRIVVECADGRADADLEIEGPDYELCSWRNPLPAFGGALSFDGQGMQPEDFVLPARPSHPLKVRVRLHSERPAPVRVMIVEQWGRPEAKVRVILIPQCRPGRNVVAEVL